MRPLEKKDLSVRDNASSVIRIEPRRKRSSGTAAISVVETHGDPPLVGASGFKPGSRRKNMRALLSTMCVAVAPEPLLTAGAVASPKSEENPAELLFRKIHGGHPLIFYEGPQDERAVQAACATAMSFKTSGTAGPVRVISFSAANGWRELYPETGKPMCGPIDEEGHLVPDAEPLPYDRAHEGAILGFADSGYNDMRLIQELFHMDAANNGPDPSTQKPLPALKAIDQLTVKGDESGPGRTIFVMEGLGAAFAANGSDNHRILQQMKDMRKRMKSDKHILFNDSPAMVPDAYRALGTTFSIPLPGVKQLATQAFSYIADFLYDPKKERAPADVTDQEIADWKKALGVEIDEEKIRERAIEGLTIKEFWDVLPKNKWFTQFVEQLRGFNLVQAKELMGEALSAASEAPDHRLDYDFVADRRSEMMMKNVCLEHVKPSDRLPKLVGMQAVQEEMPLMRTAFLYGSSLENPVRPPRFVLFAGVQGNGKSLACKGIGRELGLEVYRLPMEALFEKWLGNTEQKFDEVLRVIEALSPCVLWIDEIEKGMGGAEGQQQHEVSNRLHGRFLTWLQEHNSKVLAVATCNEPQKLSAALRSRADLKWMVDYYKPDELPEIWMANLNVAGKHSIKAEDAASFSQAKPSVVGRDIEQIISKARQRKLHPLIEEKRKEVAKAKRVDVQGVELSPAEVRELEHAVVLRPDDIRSVVERFVTEFERDPEHARRILGLSSGYQTARGDLRPYIPPVPGVDSATAKPVADDRGAVRSPRSTGTARRAEV
jgi:SpoVK/Ycf46/Vps4 family AAA+-type ATPase